MEHLRARCVALSPVAPRYSPRNRQRTASDLEGTTAPALVARPRPSSRGYGAAQGGWVNAGRATARCGLEAATSAVCWRRTSGATPSRTFRFLGHEIEPPRQPVGLVRCPDIRAGRNVQLGLNRRHGSVALCRQCRASLKRVRMHLGGAGILPAPAGWKPAATRSWDVQVIVRRYSGTLV